MWYNVKYSCGHEGRVQLYGKNSERKRRISYFENYCVCSECYKAQKEQEMQEQGYEEVRMHYGEYKRNYSDCKTKSDSYDKETKTIVVYVQKGEINE